MISNANYKIFLAILIIISFVSVIPKDTSGENVKFNLPPKTSEAKGNTFNLALWEVKHFPQKWIHIFLSSITLKSKNAQEQNDLIKRYLELNKIIEGKNHESKSSNIFDPETSIESTFQQRDLIINEVEEILESHINEVLLEKNLASWGKITFPPVDIRLGETPLVLITSPRDRIFRLHDVLIDPKISIEEIELLEEKIADEENLSALISPIGGIATFPASIPHGTSLDKILTIASHEWFHHYAFFHPPGQNMHDSNSMQTLNETVASLVGQEIAQLAKASIEKDFGISQNYQMKSSKEFDFDHEMKMTRRKTESFLLKNKTIEAEEYMEARRKIFNQNGHNIRKLNQAWFAFHGTYGESAASISPIGQHVRQLRKSSPNLRSFLSSVLEIKSFDEFTKLREKSNIN